MNPKSSKMNQSVIINTKQWKYTAVENCQSFQTFCLPDQLKMPHCQSECPVHITGFSTALLQVNIAWNAAIPDLLE